NLGVFSRKQLDFLSCLKTFRLSSERLLDMTETGGRSYGAGDDEDQALQERMAKREERRQRRMKEALERQSEDAEEKTETHSPRREEKERKEPREEEVEEEEEEEEPAPEGGVEAQEGEDEEEEQKEEVVEDEPSRSYAIEQVRLIFFPLFGLFAERKLEELKRRRDDAESEEFERMRQRQQEAEAELEELKRKREERRKVLEEEERQKKEEEAERKAKEEEEKRKMKEEIERRRAEAAEKRQKVEDNVDGEDRPFKCVSPRGSSLKVSPQFSASCPSMWEFTKESRSPRSGAVDLPMVTDSIRSIKSMWEKGNVFTSPGSGGGTFKEAAVIKTGVAGRINDWLNKTPESVKTPGGRPADLKPVDVTNKRSLWENKGATPTKVAPIHFKLFTSWYDKDRIPVSPIRGNPICSTFSLQMKF
uniref:Caldesmon 1b n=1 Tax=Mola mola TaxID=94237 RepID=A0A3Q3VVZ3_MOLML